MSNNSSSRNSPPTREPTRAEINALAYRLYIEGGRRDGRDIEDWLRAEKMLRQRPILLDLDVEPALASKPVSNGAPQKIRALDERERSSRRGKREEGRARQRPPAARRSSRTASREIAATAGSPD